MGTAEASMLAGSADHPTLLQHLRSFAAGPGLFALLIPALIVHFNESSYQIFGASKDEQSPWFLLPAGVFYLVAGIVVMLVTNMAFHKEGRGTLAPWNAPKRLVVQGLYRYTRNPMFLGAFAIVFGEALIFNSRALLWYFLVLVAAQMVHVPLNEERWLRRGFGAEYEEYCRHVPRWLPRRTPYVP